MEAYATKHEQRYNSAEHTDDPSQKCIKCVVKTDVKPEKLS
jgi:hypothetical protein